MSLVNYDEILSTMALGSAAYLSTTYLYLEIRRPAIGKHPLELRLQSIAIGISSFDLISHA